MKILALDSSGKVASVALSEDGTLKAEYSVNDTLTHSQTLMVMVDEAVKRAGWEISGIDVIGVAAGPGSFTGLRIGGAAAKGLAFALKKPIAPVPTLDAMAYGLYGFSGLICPMMDARREQVYTALYSFDESCAFNRIKEPCAISIDELAEEINARGERVVLLGDGFDAYRDGITPLLKVACHEAPLHLNRQRAGSVAALAYKKAIAGALTDAGSFVPDYIRDTYVQVNKA